MNNEYAGFTGTRRIATGSLLEVATAAKRVADSGAKEPILAFDADGRQFDFDLRGTPDEVASRYAEPARTAGRPKLGVTAREVTLLPAQWDWLAGQPGGASVAIRRLVHSAMKDSRAEAKAAKEATYRFMSAIAGNLPNFEEASRALYAGERAKFLSETADWPADVRSHLEQLGAAAFNGDA